LQNGISRIRGDILTSVTTPALASANFFVPGPYARLWRCLLQLFPALRSEYMQALVLLVCPLILVATILLIDLRTRRRVLADHDAVTYRPSLAVRFAWTTAMTVLLANLFPTRHQNWILLSANLLALLELVRTFRRSLTLTPEGLHWRSLTVRPCSPGTISHASRKSARLSEPNTSSSEMKIKYLC